MSGTERPPAFLPPSRGAFLVAHRAGNDLRSLQQARALDVPLIEADLHLFGGRVEVRHLKTAGPLPILWDRWKLASPWSPRLLLHELLLAAGPAELMLDLKGRDGRLPAHVADALARTGHDAPITVCSRRWDLLAPLERREGVRVVHSVGSARQLAAIRRQPPSSRLEGISIHRKLLDRDTVAELRERAALLMAWPVETEEHVRRLTQWGVQGLISARFAELTAVVGSGRRHVVA